MNNKIQTKFLDCHSGPASKCGIDSGGNPGVELSVEKLDPRIKSEDDKGKNT